ncbi:sigma factor [Gordonia sp. 852002-50816_SCH5313054-c]|uniref:sigma factor n=1 Tax=Gordonia sp. 852002-50816_SCH5313054-c TaxID=1834093 RepID=UPI0022B24F4E|nr:sigma factor [Gordonia sp. 852002-50816_SCH5313054-c]
MRAWQHADRFDPAKVSNRSWLYKIATNVCSDMLRGSRRRARSMNLSGPREPGPTSARHCLRTIGCCRSPVLATIATENRAAVAFSAITSILDTSSVQRRNAGPKMGGRDSAKRVSTRSKNCSRIPRRCLYCRVM